jgi:toxin ParE1/3/4
VRTVTRTAAAERDLEEILDWLHEHQPAVADRLPGALEVRCRLLASQPMTGRARDELQPGLRSVVVEYYTVYFVVTDDEVQIRRIVHNSRDTKSLSFDPE